MRKTMHLNIKTAATIAMVAILSACGGGGNEPIGLKTAEIQDLTRSPLDFDSRVVHTVDQQDGLSYFSLRRIEPQNNRLQAEPRYGTPGIQPLNADAAAEKKDGTGDAKFDWHDEKTFTRDLIRFADTENIQDSRGIFVQGEFPGVTSILETIPVSLNGETMDLRIFGLKNKADGGAFILFDQYSGLVSGGDSISGVPTGQHTYRGYNVFRYTPHNDGEGETAGLVGGIADGKFEMETDFSAGTGTVQANSVFGMLPVQSNGVYTFKATKLSGNITIDSTNGAFVGNGLRLTEVDLRKTEVVGVNHYEETNGSSMPARIQGLFHGADGHGVSGIYQHDVKDNGLFRGGIVGGRNFEHVDKRPWRLLYPEFCNASSLCTPGN